MRHPVTRDRLRAFLAKYGLFALLVAFVLLVAATALVFSAVHYGLLTRQPDQSFFGLWFNYFLFLFAAAPDDFAAPTGTWAQAVYLVSAVARIVLPTLFLGAVVFKLLIASSLYVKRKKLSVHRRPDSGRWELTLRLYSSTPLTIVDVRFEVYLRVPDTRPAGPVVLPGELGAPIVRNKPLKIRQHKIKWPISLTHVPYSVFMELKDDDVVIDDSGQPVRLQSIQGIDISHAKHLVLIVHGWTPQLGVDFVETHWYTLPVDVEFGRFKEIHVIYNGVPSKKWKGWKEFNGLEE